MFPHRGFYGGKVSAGLFQIAALFPDVDLFNCCIELGMELHAPLVAVQDESVMRLELIESQYSRLRR